VPVPPPSRNRPVLRWIAAALIGVVAAGSTACGDGTPDYCAQLSEIRSLDGLTAALDAGDLDAADTAAAQLVEVSRSAPAEIAEPTQALADGVVGIVALLRATDEDPGAVESQRARLQEQLGTLADDAAVVSQWAEEQCGFRLS
jgi:hypothetical protein